MDKVVQLKEVEMKYSNCDNRSGLFVSILLLLVLKFGSLTLFIYLFFA